MKYVIDPYLSSLAFSPAEDAFLYTAEAKSQSTSSAPNEHYDRFRYTPSFGESYFPKKRPTIFIFKWSPESTSLSTISPPLGIFFGQAIFAPDPTDIDIIYATGWELAADGRLLGIKGCTNRPSGVWEISPIDRDDTKTEPSAESPITLNRKFRKLTDSTVSCRSPRAYFDKSSSTYNLLWFCSESGGAHTSSSRLQHLSLSTKSDIRDIIETVRDPSEKGGFPGIYPNAIPAQPFIRLGSSTFFVMDSQWGSRTTVLFISLESVNKIKNLTPVDGNVYSWSVLGTDGQKRVLCSRSSPIVPPELVLGELDDEDHVHWRVIDKPDLPQHGNHLPQPKALCINFSPSLYSHGSVSAR